MNRFCSRALVTLFVFVAWASLAFAKQTLGIVAQRNGTSLTTSYPVVAPLPSPSPAPMVNFGQTKGRIRFNVEAHRVNGSGATTTTVKLQFRYNDGSTQTTYLDLPSFLDDVQGSAQPKGPTYEIEHAFSTTTNADTAFSFYLDHGEGLYDVVVLIKSNATGASGDTTKVYATAPQ